MITPPSAPNRAVISAAAGVLTRPKSTTFTPPASRPAATASRSIGPDERLSRATVTVWPACSTVANAQAKSHATRGVRLPPTVPRTPETPTINLSMNRLPGGWGRL